MIGKYSDEMTFDYIMNRMLESVPDTEVVFPVHRNPLVREAVSEELEGVPGIHLVDPMEYEPFTNLMARAAIVLTDSGGIQEEAPSLGKPVLVLRDTTERPEAVEASKNAGKWTKIGFIVGLVATLLYIAFLAVYTFMASSF